MSGASNITHSGPWGDLTADSCSHVSLTFRDTFGGNKNVNISVLASSPVGSLESDSRLPVVNFSIPPVNYQTVFSSYDPGSFAVDNIASFAEVSYNASDSLGAMSALSEQIVTTYLRTSRTAPPDVAFTLSVFSLEIVVRVRWTWLAFPLRLVTAALVFLVTTILQTRQLCVRPWKDPLLPLLTADMNDTVRRMAEGGLDMRNGLEKRVGGMTVQLEFVEKDRTYSEEFSRRIYLATV